MRSLLTMLLLLTFLGGPLATAHGHPILGAVSFGLSLLVELAWLLKYGARNGGQKWMASLLVGIALFGMLSSSFIAWYEATHPANVIK